MRNYHIISLRFETFFVRYIDYIDDEAFFSNWVTYATSKPFATYDGLFSGTFIPTAAAASDKFVTTDNVTTVCNLMVSSRGKEGTSVGTKVFSGEKCKDTIFSGGEKKSVPGRCDKRSSTSFSPFRPSQNFGRPTTVANHHDMRLSCNSFLRSVLVSQFKN